MSGLLHADLCNRADASGRIGHRQSMLADFGMENVVAEQHTHFGQLPASMNGMS
jgi:hypothetical protein